MYEIVIKCGVIVDGAGNPWYKANIGIKNGKIKTVTRHEIKDGEKVLEVGGLVVSPGFVDIHCHTDQSILVHNKAVSRVMQGLTTDTVGHCGSAAYAFTEEYREILEERMRARFAGEEIDWTTLEEWRRKVESKGTGLNLAPFCGHNTIRTSIMGAEGEGGERFEPTAEELEGMKNLVAQAMEHGAFGMTNGLEFAPGRNATTKEVIEICKVVAKHGGVYISHIRNEDVVLIESVKEFIRTCDEAALPGCISHHKAAQCKDWGKPHETMRLIKEARSKGVEVITDVYPWTFAATSNLGRQFLDRDEKLEPEKLIEQLKDSKKYIELKRKALERFEPEDTAEKRRVKGLAKYGIKTGNAWHPLDHLHVAYSKTRPDLFGMNFYEAANWMDVDDPWEAMRRLYIEDGGTTVMGESMLEEDVIHMYKQPWTCVSTDGSAQDYPLSEYTGTHPRNYGTYPRVLGRYVREMRILTLEEAVRKMTSLPAGFIGLQDRGLIREGFWADITVFDPETVGNRATYADPCQYPEGIKHVLVNGELVVEDGKHTGALPGRVLRHKTPQE